MVANPSSSRVALVTGASAGIGKSIVRRLLAQGWTVYGAARRTAQMEDLVAQGAHALAMDVTDEASMAAGVDAILAAEGRIDALVNNAGYGSYGALEDVPLDEARRQFEVNVFGAMRLTQLVLPTMRAARRGHVVNITSMGGEIWMPIGGWYHATKHALEVLSDVLRMEVAPFGIHVVVVQPGSIETEWSGISADNLEKTASGTVYTRWVAPMVRLLRAERGRAHPDVVAQAVSAAVSTDRPRRRYATPFDAKALVFLVRWLPTWVFERIVAGVVR
ncbi:MAG: SDR family NAD(P)-dependent oxidoreductase [Alphaproteobacteria bacterium]|nr:SDR family NAD(P)-dependent oxidoreductase [Alphaproteobacteria bacterium]